MFRPSLVIFGLFSSLALIGCGSSTPVIGTIGDESITLREFEEMYAKNNGGWEKASTSNLEERQRFLDLLVKYRLKLKEARKQQLLEDPEIQSELASYRKTVASTYVIEKELIEPNLKTLYQRKTEELRASHVLLRVSPSAAPDDTLQAYLKAKTLIALGEKLDFDSVAATYSEDPSAAQNRGDLGWFSQGRMVGEFEDAVYALKPGGITPEPVRTQFGYHVIKLTGRRLNKGSVRVSHILKRFDPSGSDTAAVRDTIFSVYRRLREGEISFPEAVRLYSDDPSSVERGGDIGLYEWSVIPQDVSGLLNATPAGSIAPPYRANYGFHIFTVTETRPVPPYAELEKDLRTLYQQRYYANDYEEFLHGLKKSYKLSFDVKFRKEFSTSFLSEKTPRDSDWTETIGPTTAVTPLFTYDKKTFTVQDFVDRVNASDEFRTYSLTPQRVDEMIDRIADATILDEHASTAAKRHSGFKDLMKEYEHGILIYQIDQNEIWKKIAVNDSLMREYFENNRVKFRWPDRVNVGEVFCRQEIFATEAFTRVSQGEDFGDVAAEMTARPGFREKRGEWGLLPYSTNQLTSMAANIADDSVSAPFRFENGWSVITVLGRDRARNKTFEEALPEVTSKYQEESATEREREWIDSLRRKYGVTVDPGKLSDAFVQRENR